LVDAILPTEEVHLIGGSSGSGKTTWALQFLTAWSAGESFFGYDSHPLPFVYISGDRSSRGVERTMRRMDIEPSTIPFLSAVDLAEYSAEKMIHLALQRHPHAKLIVIEGMSSLVPGGKASMIDFALVRKFLTSLTRFCQKRHVTILGVVHSPKTKKGEEYENPRERISGSTAWAAFSETIILIERKSLGNPKNTLRRLFLLPRNAPEQLFEMDFRDGLLVPVEKRLKPADPAPLIEFLDTRETDDIFRIDEITARVSGVTSRTVYRWLEKMEQQGKVKRVRQGEYKVLPPDPLETMVM
jgi:hypothetical protein